MIFQYSRNTILIATISCIVSAGCVGVGSGPANLSIADTAPTDSAAGETAAKPIVRSQSGVDYGSNWGGTSVSVGTDATRYPMPVSGKSPSGRANRTQTVGTTVNDGSYNTQAQFTNPYSAARGSQVWPETTTPSRPPPPTGYGGSVQSQGGGLQPPPAVQPPNSGWDVTVPRVSQLPEGPFPPSVNNGRPEVSSGLQQNEPMPVSPPIGDWPQAFGPLQTPAPPGGIVPPSQQFADIIVNV